MSASPNCYLPLQQHAQTTIRYSNTQSRPIDGILWKVMKDNAMSDFLWPGLILAAVLIWVVWCFNRLVRLRNQVRTAWSDIDVQLARRHDLIPQLVRTVQAYTDHERSLLTAVTELRARAVESQHPGQLAALENELEQSLSRLFILQESYPDLKADGNFSQLQRDLVETENLLQYARRFYNGAVRALNDRVLQFPDLLIARVAGFSTAEFFSAAEDQRDVVSVNREGIK